MASCWTRMATRCQRRLQCTIRRPRSSSPRTSGQGEAAGAAPFRLFWNERNAKGSSRIRLPHGLLLHRDGVSAARGTARATAQLLDVEPELGDGTAESVAVHSQLTCGLALVPLAILQHGENKFFLELTDGFCIRDAALVHLHDQCFQLIFHSASLCLLNAPSK